MYAIVEIAGKQYRVAEKDRIRVPLLQTESGKKVEFDRVLLLHDDKDKVQFGSPLLDKVKVSATVLEHGREKKIIVFKKKRRKGYQKKNGHRQDFSLVQIDKIGAGTAAKATKAEEKAEKPAPKAAKEEKAEKAAEKKPAAKTAKKAPAKKAPAKKTAAKPKAAPKKADDSKTTKEKKES